MKLKLLLNTVTTVTALLISSQLFANGLSIGLTYGQSSDELTAESCENDRQYFFNLTGGGTFTCSVDDSGSAIGINLGYHFTNMWGLELGYMDLGQTSQFLNGPDFGVFETTGTTISDPETIDTTAAYFAGTVTFDLVDKLSLTGKLGVAQVEYDLVPTLFQTGLKDKSTSFMAGLSLNYNFLSNWSAHLRYGYFDTDYDKYFIEDDLSISVTSLGVSYKF